jgi:hypothetical protein
MDAITGYVLLRYIAEALAHSDFQGTSRRNLGELCERHSCLCASPRKAKTWTLGSIHGRAVPGNVLLPALQER